MSEALGLGTCRALGFEQLCTGDLGKLALRDVDRDAVHLGCRAVLVVKGVGLGRNPTQLAARLVDSKFDHEWVVCVDRVSDRPPHRYTVFRIDDRHEAGGRAVERFRRRAADLVKLGAPVGAIGQEVTAPEPNPAGAQRQSENPFMLRQRRIEPAGGRGVFVHER